LSTTKVSGVPNNISFGWEGFVPQGEFSIKESSLLYRGVELIKLFKIKGLAPHKAKIVYNSKESSIIASDRNLWDVDDTVKVLRLQ
jgi:hypothetical protein